MGALSGFGLRPYSVLIEYVHEGKSRQVVFSGIQATSVMKAKEQARLEFTVLTHLSEDIITAAFAVLTP